MRSFLLCIVTLLPLSLVLFCDTGTGTNPAPDGPEVNFLDTAWVTPTPAGWGEMIALKWRWDGLDIDGVSYISYQFKGNCLRIQDSSDQDAAFMTLDSTVFTIDTNTVVHPSTDSTAIYYPMDIYIISSRNAADAGTTIKTLFRINIYGSFIMLEIFKAAPGAQRPTGDDIADGNATLSLRRIWYEW